jgi:PAS domain S-box-containing protein
MNTTLRIFPWLAGILIAVALLLPGPGLAQAAQKTDIPRTRNVLALHSYNPGLSWTKGVNAGMRETLENGDVPFIYRVEYLDTKRNPDPTYRTLLYRTLKHKLRGKKFDVILLSDNNALDFALAHREELFPDTPIVFCGVNNFHAGMLQREGNITGISEEPAIRETMALARRLHPDTREFVIIGGQTLPTDIITDRTIRAMEREFPDITFTYWNDLPARELKKRLTTLSRGQLIFVHGIMRNEQGVLIDYHEKNAFLAGYAPVPIYGFWDFELGVGCIGGKVISSYEQGAMAAGMALRILDGTDPEEIPVSYETPTRHMFDYEQLKRFDISRDDLPRDSQLVNAPPHFYRVNKTYIWATLLLIGVLTGTVTFLSINIERRKVLEAELRTHRTRLEDLIQERTEKLTQANRELESEIYERNKVEAHLRQARAGLRIEVENRTADLKAANRNLEREIEHRKRIEEELKDREARARAIINAPTESLLLIDREGGILDLNATAAARFDHTQEELKGRNIFDLIPENVRDVHRRALAEVLREGRPVRHQDEQDGSYLDRTVYPVFDDTGRVSRVAVFMADITKAKELERQVMLLDKVNSLGRVAAGIAHEIRNPLTGINTYLYSLETLYRSGKEECVDQEMADRIFGQIKAASRKIESVIKRVIDFSKPGVPRFSTISLNRPVEDAVKLLETTLRKSRVRLILEPAPDLPPVHADGLLLEQVTMNLVDNAARAMAGQAGDKIIEVRTFADRDRVVLEVADSGPGVPDTARDKIFDPFFTTKSDGTGIGLSIVQRIVADHNGFIRVDNSSSGGALFRVELPPADNGSVPWHNTTATT